MARSLRLILFLSIPSSVGLVLLATPVVRLTLERGAFDAHSTALVAAALVWYAIAVFAHSGTEILSRGFYAVADTRTPVALAVLAVVVNGALSAALVAPFGVRGLAAATSIAAIVEFGLLFRALAGRIGEMRGRGIGISIYRTLAASIVMGQVMVLLALVLRALGTDIDSPWGALVLTVGVGSVGLVSFLVTAAWLRSHEVEEILQRLGG